MDSINWIEIISGILAIIIGGFLIPLIRNKAKKSGIELSTEEHAYIMRLVEDAVRWAEQELWKSSGAYKKDRVMDWLLLKLTEMGIVIAEEDLSKLIEATVEKVRKEADASGN